MSNIKIKSGLISFALLVIAAGALLFCSHMGLFPPVVKSIIFSWQMLLIAIGIVALANPHPSHSGVILVIVGAVFLLPKIPVPCLYMFQTNGCALCWALLLILLGIYVLCMAIFGKGRHCCSSRQHKPHIHFPRGGSGYIDRNYVFGGGEEFIDMTDFKGGEINCVFGGAEIDLSRAQLAEGTHTLSINAVFGGITLFVPPHWKVELHPTSVCGAFEDKRIRSHFDVEENKTLIIAVSTVFGGGEIRTR